MTPRSLPPGTIGVVASAVLCVLLSGCCSAGPNARFPASVAPPVENEESVMSIDVDLIDEERGREVPVRIHLPADREGPLPVVFVSHGIGESRSSYEWLGKALASSGYAVIHPTHRGTDRDKLEEGWIAMYKATRDRENWRNRPLDISFVLDRIATVESADARLEGAFDEDRVGVVGHSAGAWTAAAIGGLELENGESFRDPRVAAIAPLSMPRTKSVKSDDAWASITLPALHMTGTCDRQIVWMTFPHHRRIPWENGVADDQYLLTLEGGRHTTFSNEWDASKTRESALQIVITRAVAAFLDAYVAGNQTRLQELRAGGFQEIAPTLMHVEQRTQ